MNDKFFPELARRLKREGIATSPVEKGCLPVLADGRAAVLVMPRGGVVFNADAERGPAEGLHEGFRVLADFNGVVLAGQELEADWGYKFATWRRSPDRTAVGNGDYFDGGHFYGAAKLDFACRAGLVDGHRQFTDEQLVELYRCVCETLESGYPLTKERREVLEQAAEQIEGSVDDLDHRVSLSNQRELEAADQQADRGPEMGMSP